MPDPKPIEYDRTATTVTVRGFRTLLTLLVINTLMLGWFVVGPQASRFAQEQWANWNERRAINKRRQAALAAYRQCATHVHPRDRVLYEEHAVAATKLVSNEAGYAPVGTRGSEPASIYARHPEPWTALPTYFPHAVSVEDDVAVVYLHEHVSPGGHRRFIVLRLHPLNDLALAVASFTPFTGDQGFASDESMFIKLSSKSGPGSISDASSPALTVLAGQPDETDPSHFTIPYRVDGRPGVIDGWLRDDGLILKPRNGDVNSYGNQRFWRLLPSTMPTTAP